MGYYQLFKDTKALNQSQTKFSTSSFLDSLFRATSFFITPFFLLTKTSPNTITFLGLILGLIGALLICVGSQTMVTAGVVFFFLAIFVDYCDGNVARMTGTSSFFGRFIDGAIDIVNISAIRLAFVSVLLNQNSNIIAWVGIICAVITPFHHLFHDRYSAHARWMNEENKTLIKPYVKASLSPRFANFLADFQFICIIAIPFFYNQPFWKFIVFVYFLQHIIMGLFYVFLLTRSSYVHMNTSAKNHRG